MQLFKTQNRKEQLVYTIVWALIFVAPVINNGVQALLGREVAWSDVWHMWGIGAIYLVTFIIHNHLLAPLLVNKRKPYKYFAWAAVLLIVSTLYHATRRPHDMPPPRERVEYMAPPMRADGQKVMPLHPEGPPRPAKGHEPYDAHAIVAFAMTLLMFATNLGIKSMFRHEENEKRLAQLKQHNLQQEIALLRYQINPHFLMNTLNNIHALVDIDSEKAKSSIVHLSQMMRYALTQKPEQNASLGAGIEFLRNYIRLMSIRYSDDVSITYDLPESCPDTPVPPMILVPFVENAFKYGISYQEPSFVDIKLTVPNNEFLLFVCRNSKHAATANKKGTGIGLKNVKKRLDLIYGDKYQLNIDDSNDVYSVNLTLPLKQTNNPADK